MRFTLIVLLLLCSSSFLYGYFTDEELLRHLKALDEPKPYAGFVIQVLNSVSQQIEDELGLQFMGNGGSRQEKVEEMGLNFRANRRATIEEARALHLYILDKLVDAINNHEKLQPYLEERPFTFKRVKVNIYFRGPFGLYNDGTVSSVTNTTQSASARVKYKIFYEAIDPLTGNSIELFDEQHDEAVERAKEANLTFPFAHKITVQETVLDEIFVAYAEDVRKKLGLECKDIGINMTQSIIAVRLNYTGPVDQATARECTVRATKKLLTYLNNSNSLRPFLKEHPLNSKHVELLVNFIDERYVPYIDGPMHSVKLENDELVYYKEMHIPVEGIRKSRQSTRTDPIAKETYFDALKITENTSFFDKLYRLITEYINGWLYFFVNTRDRYWGESD